MPYMKKKVPEKLRILLKDAESHWKDADDLAKSTKQGIDKVVLYTIWAEHWEGYTTAIKDVCDILGIDLTPMTGK